ncbi:MAG: GAF domain-containing protein [Phototrophicaceae bacterium]
MNQSFSQGGLVAWYNQLWFRLLVGFFLAVVAPSLSIGFFLFSVVVADDTENATRFLRQTTLRQQQELDSSFGTVQITLLEFVLNSSNEILLSSSIRLFDTLEANDLQDTLYPILSDLQDEASEYIERVRLVDLEGNVVGGYWNDDPRFIGWRNEIDTDNFKNLIAQSNASQESDELYLLVAQPTNPLVELAVPVFGRVSTAPIGFLLVTLKADELLRNTFLTNERLPLNSFIIDTKSAVIFVSDEEHRPTAYQFFVSNVAQSAFNQIEQSAVYEIEGVEYIGYYAQVEDGLFLISHLPTNSIVQTPVRLLGTSGMVLAIGVLALSLVAFVYVYNSTILPPLQRLEQAIHFMRLGNYDLPVNDVNRSDEFGLVARSFVEMRQHIYELVTGLEQRVFQRSRDVALAQQINEFVARQRGLIPILSEMTRLIVSQFSSVYYAQIFLVDDDRRMAVLKVGSGEIGVQLLSQGYRVNLSQIQHPIVRSIIESKSQIVDFMPHNSTYELGNPTLAANRHHQVSIPLRLGDSVIGVLDVHSQPTLTFDENLVQLLETLGGQLAILVDNARLNQTSEERLREIEAFSRERTVETWQEFMQNQRRQQYISHSGLMNELDWSGLRMQALTLGEVVVGQETERHTVPLVIPIILRGQIVGVIECELPRSEVSQNKLALAKTLADRLAISLDSVRLFMQAQAVAERERLINNIASKLTSQTDIEAILQMAIREVGQVLHVPEVSVRLIPSNQDSESKI